MNLHRHPVLADVLEGLRSRPLRSTLSVTSLGAGMLTLSLLFAVLDAFAARADAIVSLLGANAFAVVADRPADGDDGHLDVAHVRLLRANLPDARIAHARHDQVQSPGIERRITVLAADATLAAVKGWRAAEGRLLDHHDEIVHARNTVISHALQLRTGWRPGQTVRLGEQAFTIVGVLAPHDASLSAIAAHPALLGGTDIALVPYTLTPDWLSGFATRPDGRVDAMFVALANDRDIERDSVIALRLLEQAQRSAGEYSIVTPDLLTAGIGALRDSIAATVGAVAVMALALGGSTLMSLMLANVRERVVEIGLRRSLGATQREVAQLFVIEALLMTLAAAFAGIAGAALLLDLVAGLLGTALALSAAAVLLPVLTGVVLALLFSYWPARLAASIQPAAALRTA